MNNTKVLNLSIDIIKLWGNIYRIIELNKIFYLINKAMTEFDTGLINKGSI